jgi:hypothetical protein
MTACSLRDLTSSRTSAAKPRPTVASRGWEIVANFVEPGVSATDDRRPECQRMIDAATTKPPLFGVILVHSFSRFFRDQEIRRISQDLVRSPTLLRNLTRRYLPLYVDFADSLGGVI